MYTELQLGPVNLKQLAEWFGIQHSSIRAAKCKEKKLEILKSFARYHMEGNTIIIDEIFEPVYSKAYDKVEQEFDSTWHKNGIDTCARVGATIYYKNKTMQAQIKKETACNYVYITKKKKYGRNHVDEYGTDGYCEYIWCVPSNNPNEESRELTPEEKKIMMECSKEAYAIKGEAATKKATLADALAHKEITIEEYNEGLSESEMDVLAARERFVAMVTKRLGFYPETHTKIHKCAYTTEEVME